MADNVAIRKQTQITQAGRTMFIWIAIASALVGTAIVVSIFLGQKLIYTEKVLAEKQNTVSNLNANLATIDDLKKNVRVLDANTALLSIRANESDQALQVVLDALPSDANALALGASLQHRLLTGVEGNYTLETLKVDPVAGSQAISSSTTVDVSVATGGDEIPFSFSVKGDQLALQGILRNLERSIRTIVVTSMNIETQGGALMLSVDGKAFYQPSRVLELTDLTVKAD